MSVSGTRAFLGSMGGLVATVLAAALGLYLLVFHTTHVLLFLPYLALLACPLMHVLHRRYHAPAPSSDGADMERRATSPPAPAHLTTKAGAPL
jgi:hypothetical protein